MRRLVLGLVAVFCVFFVAAYTLAEKTSEIKISTREDRRAFTHFDVIATLPTVTADYRWIEVYICTADLTYEGDVRCDFFWERRSLQETRPDQRQYVFPYRFVPRTKILILAHASNSQWKTLATGRKVVLR